MVYKWPLAYVVVIGSVGMVVIGGGIEYIDGFSALKSGSITHKKNTLN